MAAFEKSSTGDPELLSIEESLRRSVDILLDTDDLFAVEGQTELDGDLRTATFVSIFKNQQRGYGGESGAQSKYKTAEDRLRGAAEKEPDYFTDEVLPDFDPVRALI